MNTDARTLRIRQLLRFGYAANETEAAVKVDAEIARGVALRAEKAARTSKQAARAAAKGKDGRFLKLGTCSFCKGPLGVDWYGRTIDGVRVQSCECCAD